MKRENQDKTAGNPSPGSQDGTCAQGRGVGEAREGQERDTGGEGHGGGRGGAAAQTEGQEAAGAGLRREPGE